MNRKIKTLSLSPFLGRTICISDIHGNLKALLALLDKVDYHPGIDRLILLGDLIEKGNQNLDTLHTIMEMTKIKNTYCLMGNCDFICKNVLYSYRLDFLKQVLLSRSHSLIHEMAQKIGLHFDQNTKMDTFCFQLRHHFLKELSFLNDLPHVIEDDSFIFSHAAIQDEKKFGNDFKEVMTIPFFKEREVFFQKKVIVGHLPVTEYARSIANFNPILDHQRNIYSIDGGNIVKKGGQLNALLINQNTISYETIDFLPQAKVIQAVKPGIQIPLFVTWNHGQIQILKEETYQYKVYCPYLHRTFWVDKEFVYKQGEIYHATDFTNYEIPLEKGDLVKIVFSYRDKVQIKKNGVLGWTYKKNIEIV